MILNKKLALIEGNKVNVISDVEGEAWLKNNGFETSTSKVRAGVTPISLACKNGNLPICQWLVKKQLICTNYTFYYFPLAPFKGRGLTPFIGFITFLWHLSSGGV